jgi:pimeloyl-ACP methyl ester carboxylesterase
MLHSGKFARISSLDVCRDLSIMPKLVFSVAVLATAAVISVGGCFSAVSEPAAASGKKIAAVLEPSAGPRAAVTHVYLMRGFLNVFSLGMDSLAAELRGAGISATVDSYFDWHEVAHAIAANYKAGQRGPIVLIGHSFGADSVMDMGTDLGQEGVPVALIVAFDGTYSHAASANVARVLNLYKGTDRMVTRGPGFHGELTNYYVADANVTHPNIDKVPRLHAMVINKIKGVRGSGAAALPKTSG